MKQIFRAFLKQGALLALLGLVLFGVQALAYTPPTDPPPGGNVAAPLNTGISDQVKLGGLSVRGLLEALGGLRVAGITQLNVSSPPNPTGLAVQGNTVLGAVGETDSADKTLVVKGDTKTNEAFIAGAADCANGLITQSDGKVVCNPNGFNFDNFCNLVTTSIFGKEVKPIPMQIDGRNICVDKSGCSYRVWSYDLLGIDGALGNHAIIFMQQPNSGTNAFSSLFNGPNTWFDSLGNTRGKNGSAESEGKDKIQGWSLRPFKLYDDYNNYNGFTFADNDRNTLVMEDNDATRGYAVTLCDF